MAKDLIADKPEERDRWPADQQFGAQAAADQEKVDNGATEDEVGTGAPPRAGNKDDDVVG